MGQALQAVPPILRSSKGSDLTYDELDLNFSNSYNFSNAVAGFFGISLNPDGSLQANSVLNASVKDRELTASKIKLNFLPVVTDTGTTNTIAIAFDPPLTAMVNGLVAFIYVSNLVTGATTVNWDGLGPITLYKNGGQDIASGDILNGQLICVAYKDGKCYLVQPNQPPAGGGSGSSFSGTIKDEPTPVALPGAGSASTFTHGFADTPDDYSVALINVTPWNGYVTGQEVPVGNFIQTTKEPAFSVESNNTAIVVTQLAATIQLSRIDGGFVGTMATINAGDWNIKVRASRTTASAGLIFPALSLQVMQPKAAVGYGSSLFFFHRNKNSNVTTLDQLNMATGEVKLIDSLTTMDEINAALFRNGAGQDVLVWCSSLGIWWILMQDPTPTVWSSTEFGANGSNWQNYKPVQVDEGTGPSSPTVYMVQCNYGTSTTDSLGMKAVNTSAGSNPNNSSDVGSALNLRTGSINNIAPFNAWHGAASKIMHFQFNPIKKRIYVITDETGFVHIFTINNASIKDWWASGSRYTDMTYVKALALSGPGNGVRITQNARYTIEFDLTTGQEKSIAYGMDGDGNGAIATAGSITRVPWMEN